MFDLTVHLGDLIMGLGVAFGGWRLGIAFRDQLVSLNRTVYGSDREGVEGLVNASRRHDENFIRLGIDRRSGMPDRRYEQN